MIRSLFLAGAAIAAVTAAAPIEYDYADVNGVRLHYARSGSGQLMLFIHGFPEFSYAWNKQLTEFGTDHLAVAPDMRGYNLSSKPEGAEQYRFPVLVEDVRALAAKLGHDAKRKFILVAHDMGGMVAWLYAATYPETVEKLIIVNAPHPTVFARELTGSFSQQKASLYALVFRRPDAEKLLSANNYDWLVTAVLSDGLKNGYFTETDKAEYLKSWAQPGALTGAINYYRATQFRIPAGPNAPATPAAIPPLPKITVPTMVIWGEKDTMLLTGNLEGLDAHVAQLTVRRIPQASHWVVHEQPALVNKHIRAFIR